MKSVDSAIKEPAYTLGVDLSKQAFGLFKMSGDTTYYPVFDLVHATQPAVIGTEDGTQMSNATVMLFPSIGKPEFQMTIILKNGTLKTFKQTLDSPLTANTRLTLTLTLGDIFSEESSGNFTIDNWNESSQTIDIPILS